MIKSLTSAHKAVIRFWVAKELGDTDMTVEECATSLGLTRRTLYTWKDEPAVAAEIERQLEEIKDSPDLFAVRSRENALFTLQANLLRLQKDFMGKGDGKGAADVSKEIRQYIDSILKHTEHVKATGTPVTARDLSDEDLLAACLKEDVAPEGMSVEQLESVARKLKRKGE